MVHVRGACCCTFSGKEKLDEDELDEILAMVDEAPVRRLVFAPAPRCVLICGECMQVREIDVGQLKQLVLRFEKSISENVKLRTKFSDKPELYPTCAPMTRVFIDVVTADLWNPKLNWSKQLRLCMRMTL